MLPFDRFEVLTFDCYGTLIDWETGLWRVLAPILAAHAITLQRNHLLEMFGAFEADVEAGPYQTYQSVLRSVLERLGATLGFVPSGEELKRFAVSVRDWPAFADSPQALQELKTHYSLAIISNVDDDLFAASNARLQVAFDWVITAQQVGSYKPSAQNFETALSRIGLPRDRVLHVAQSLYHDIAPARALGLSTVWVNRRHGQTGSGATPPASATPDLQVHDLATLVRTINLARA